MKVIDLLNKIANGEEVPKKIKVGNKVYNYETFNIGKGDNYFTAGWEEVKGYRISYDGTYYYLEIRDYNLNDEVEIIEELQEHKIPEKLPYYSLKKIQKAKNKVEWREERISLLEKRINDYHNKINEIIDYLEEIE